MVDSVASAGTAILYTTPAKRAGMVTFVQNVPEHFVRLDGPDTTVDQLLAAASQVAPALPAAGLAPRPRPAAPAAARRRGRPRHGGPALPRPRLPDPPSEPPMAPARSPGLHVDFDGGARKNPGVGGSGSLLLLVRGGSCSVLARRSDFLGDNITNNFAEFSGLNSGLQLALDFLAQSGDPVPGLRVTATGDSELVVQAMLARRALRDPALVALVKQADALVAALEALGCVVDFTHVRRALNGEADALANEAMDAKASKLTRAGDFAAARGRLPLPAPDEEDELDEPAPAPRSGRIPLLTAPPTPEQLHAWLADVHRDSRVLGRLLPSKLWPEQTTLAWTAACARFTPRLAAGLDSESELELTQAVLDLLELVGSSSDISSARSSYGWEGRRSFLSGAGRRKDAKIGGSPECHSREFRRDRRPR